MNFRILASLGEACDAEQAQSILGSASQRIASKVLKNGIKPPFFPQVPHFSRPDFPGYRSLSPPAIIA
jgi:hypothetical protein